MSAFKTLGVAAASFAAVAGLCMVACKKSWSLGELFEEHHAGSPGTDALENKLFNLRKKLSLRRFGVMSMPGDFDIDLWLDQNWPNELALYEPWGKAAARMYLEGEMTLPTAMARLRSTERERNYRNVMAHSERTQRDVFEEMKKEQARKEVSGRLV